MIKTWQSYSHKIMIKRLSIIILHDDIFDGDHAPQQDHRVTGPNGSSSLIWQQGSPCFPDNGFLATAGWNTAMPGSIPVIPGDCFDDTELIPTDKDCASNIISSTENQQNATQDGSELSVFN